MKVMKFPRAIEHQYGVAIAKPDLAFCILLYDRTKAVSSQLDPVETLITVAVDDDVVVRLSFVDESPAYFFRHPLDAHCVIDPHCRCRIDEKPWRQDRNRLRSCERSGRKVGRHIDRLPEQAACQRTLFCQGLPRLSHASRP